MSRSGQEILYEGWLTKSPPTKRIWRGRWRRRWFSLQYSEIPGQFILIYYTDRNCRKVKGYIDLEYCEQVDTGLKFDEGKLKFDFLFVIKTPQRTYYLAADTEAEMKAWVKNICGVCNLKATSDEDEFRISLTSSQPPHVNTLSREAPSESVPVTSVNLRFVESPPASVASSVSPTSVSTSPYIPISECITGRSPVLPGQRIMDFQTLLQHNLKNSYLRSENTHATANEMYDTASPTYLNFMPTDNDPRNYDLPRLLQPPSKGVNTLPRVGQDAFLKKNFDKKNCSPLQSPTDSESVFTDDDWSHNTIASDQNSGVSNPRPSDSSADGDFHKFGKSPADDCVKLPDTSTPAPPRPPKPSHVVNYLNLPLSGGSLTRKDSASSNHRFNFDEGHVQAVSDEMYDFPRSHQVETAELIRNVLFRRHCYNNAAPGTVEGQIFRYDISPKPGTSSSQIFRFDENQEEPASPLSQSSSTAMHSNLPSPLLPDCKLMPPPLVDRGLKPKRKLSDTLSISSNTEPSSPRSAPSVDRTLKPSLTMPASTVKSNTHEVNRHMRKRSEPSPIQTPQNIRRSHDSLLSENEQIYFRLSPIDPYCSTRKDYHKLEYLDLDLDNISSKFSNLSVQQPLRSPGASTVYKEVDFMKTEAFNITRNNLEKERNETVPVLKK